MYDPRPPRAVSAATSLAITAGVVAAMAFGLGVAHAPPVVPALLSVELGEPPPPPPKPRPRVVKPRQDKPAPKNDAGTRNLRNKATQIVAPPVTPLIVPPPVAVTTQAADIGNAAQTGASDLPGPGRGAGNYGDGLGGGGLGGDGDGSGDGEAVQGPRRRSGRVAYSDLPEGVLELGEEAAVTVIFAVEPDGTVSDCQVQRGSGYDRIDDLVCRLIEQRFRYRPALDRYGRPVRSRVRETHTWVANDR